MARKTYGVILASDVDEKMKQFKVDIPRGMLEIGGKSILIHQIELMRNIGIKDFIFGSMMWELLCMGFSFEGGEKLDGNEI